jgi:fructose-1,6-bisphosphatase/inositol monophosphatase family enzyme
MSEIAREAGAMLMHYFHQHLKIEYKGDADLVTAADRASETLIRERIRERWPEHDVLGEEQGLNDQGSEYRWYVDPLDGTTNFAHGYPVFCVSLGLEQRGLERRGLERRGLERGEQERQSPGEQSFTKRARRIAALRETSYSPRSWEKARG